MRRGVLPNALLRERGRVALVGAPPFTGNLDPAHAGRVRATGVRGVPILGKNCQVLEILVSHPRSARARSQLRREARPRHPSRRRRGCPAEDCGRLIPFSQRPPCFQHGDLIAAAHVAKLHDRGQRRRRDNEKRAGGRKGIPQLERHGGFSSLRSAPSPVSARPPSTWRSGPPGMQSRPSTPSPALRMRALIACRG